MEHYRAELDALASAGWTVRERTPDAVLPPEDVWPAALRDRYPNIPAALTEFVSRVEACLKADETAWFLTAADYAGTSDFAFAWNEWERMELEWSEERGDADEAAKVREFWNAYLPFYSDVSGEYTYFAVRVTEPKPVARSRLPWAARPTPEPQLGSVVYATEDDFRGVTEVAGSFDEFLGFLVAAVRGTPGEGPLAGLV